MSSLPILALKSPNKISMWYLGWLSNTHSNLIYCALKKVANLLLGRNQVQFHRCELIGAELAYRTGPPSLYNKYKFSFKFTPQETHYVSATKPNLLMLFGETVAVYCENRMEHINTLCGQKTQSVPHRNTLRLRYKAKPVNAVWGNSRCLLWELYGTHKYILWAENLICTSQETLRLRYKENRLILFRETVAVYCLRNTQIHSVGRNFNPYLTGNTLLLRYGSQPANTV
jgi:hypothetical protein